MIFTTSNIHSKLFSSFIWKGDSKNIYFTFDDGPHPEATLNVLETLNKYKIKATFFLIGKNILSQPKIVSNILNEEHSIANHSFSHKRTKSLFYSILKNEIVTTDKLLLDYSTNRLKLFRPPYGFFTINTKKVAIDLNYKICMWSILSGDFYNLSSSKISTHINKNITNGSIIVFHDNEKTKNNISDILEKTIPPLLDKGYNFASLTNE